GDARGAARGLFPCARARDGALLVSIAGSPLGSGGGDERERRLGALPVGRSGGPGRSKAGWTGGELHLRRVVTGWRLDVFHCRGERTEPHLAAAFSGRRAGANHLWANGRKWGGG